MGSNILSRPGILASAAAVLASLTAFAATAPLKLHVPSPDWRDQIVYFVVTDRFADGDSSNNDQGAGEFDSRSNARFNGGDLRGIARHIDYIRGLGATALWITPPVANQWTDPTGAYAGYHGYWAENFMRVDRHLGTLDDYRRLSHALHTQGLYLVQDIVVNHTGNFFSYAGGWDPSDPARFYQAHAHTRPVARPSQAPFDLNDPRRAADRRAGTYHWTPNVADFKVERQVFDFQMAGLDDLDTGNPVVRRALRKSYGYWIREVGVDAFRVDTAFYVPPAYFDDFLHASDTLAPGIDRVARRTGRKGFHVFGEGFGLDGPGREEQSRRIEGYMTAANGSPRLPGMINFPLYGALVDVFARGRPTAELADGIQRTLRVHARPHLMPTFLDNHDVDRFLAGGSEAGLRQGLLAIMTLPGIPTVYYGTEQGFTEQRGAMFAAGYASGGRDRYDTTAPLYRFIAAASALRRSNRVFSRGTPEILKDNPAAAGALAYRMSHEGDSALVVFNTSDAPSLLDNLDTGLPEGTVLEGHFGIDGRPANLLVGTGGRVTMQLAPRCGLVWKVAKMRVLLPAGSASLTLDALPPGIQGGDFALTGTARGLRDFQLVVDGDLRSARTIVPGSDDRWQALVDTSRMMDPATRHAVVAWSAAAGAVSAAAGFQVSRPWTLLADVEDPAGDDVGARGTYTYPDHESWGANRQMDLRRLRVAASGGALRIDLTMNKLTTSWNPSNGFDHVAFTIFIEMPGREGGSAVMPFQGGNLPAGMRWHYRLRANGWTNALFTSALASPTHDGTPATPAARILADPGTDTVSFILPAASLGNPASLAGAKLYVTTWDYDGGYRELTRERTAYSIGGGDPERDPRVMDDTAVIVLP